MAWAVNVVFSPGGKVYSFDPNGHELAWDERVICSTSRGLEIARVVTANHEVERSPKDPPLRPVERRATPDDEARVKENKTAGRKAMLAFRDLLRERRIENARPIGADVAFDGSRIALTYRAEERTELRAVARAALEQPRLPGRGAPGQPARGGQAVRRRRHVRAGALLHALPLARAADHAAHGQGSGRTHEPGPHHRPVRPPALLPGLRASRLPLVPRPRAGRRPHGQDAAGPRHRAQLQGARRHARRRARGRQGEVDIRVDDASEITR